MSDRRWWSYGDPAKVLERKQNYSMMKNAKVRQWAKSLAKITLLENRRAFLMMIPEIYRDAVEFLARGWRK